MTVKPLTAREILLQSRDLIESTYWIKNFEVKTLSTGDVSVKTPIVVNIESDYNPTYEVRVVGVCSIGAMALAVAQNSEEKTLKDFSELFSRDWNTRCAGEALAAAINKKRVRWTTDDVRNDATHVIAAWNDAKKRTRKDVIATFSEALESPLLKAKNLWYLGVGTRDRYFRKRFYGQVWATKKEADAFIAEVKGRGEPHTAARAFALYVEQYGLLGDESLRAFRTEPKSMRLAV